MDCLPCFDKILHKKTFSLNHELDVKIATTERLYDPKRKRWTQFLIIPFIIGFPLLLILSNVDFSDESQIQVQLFTTAQTVKNESEHGTTDILSITAAEAMEMAILDKVPGMTCNDGSKRCQTIICTGGPIRTISFELENFDKYCGNVNFDVILENCTFHEKTIAKDTFAGLYNMRSLTIRYCELEKIVDNAFKQTTMKKLTDLTFEVVQLNLLTDKSFIGLVSLENFKLKNKQTTDSASLSAIRFLQPMAKTLSSLVVQQKQTSYSAGTIYDPKDWLSGVIVFEKLVDVELSGTNFNNTLNGDTFVNLMCVRRLYIANCNLTIIAENTFDCIMLTLNLLDLRDNKLQTLDGEFLMLATLRGIAIKMTGNQWSCSCEHQAIVEFVKQLKTGDSIGPTCASPRDVQGVEMRYVQLQCDDITTLPILTTIAQTIPLTNPTISTTENVFLEILTTANPESYTTATSRTATQSISTTGKNTITMTKPTTLEITEINGKPTLQTTEYISPILKSSSLTTESSTSTPGLPPEYQGCGIPLPGLLTCSYLSRCKYGNFFVEVLSTTSVELQIGSYGKELKVIYFEAFTYKATLVDTISSKTPESKTVNNLKSNQSYTFCLIQYNDLKTSPFDCRSAYLPLEESNSWLKNSDKTIFFTIVICITVVCCISGITVIYCLLRWRPTLLYGSKRLQRINLTSHEVLLFAKSYNSRTRSSCSADITTENYSELKSYIQYFTQNDINKHRNVSYNRPPTYRAPAVPNKIGSAELQSENVYDGNNHIPRSRKQFPKLMPDTPEPSAGIRLREQNNVVYEFENEYESLDYYQEVY
ncbi:uncharacterized protein [Eurosta solidaginis]|uniref:uncharacterized protein n=1 Tax=Eurosta solidaginis TaxID=178769 RepID=UPI003530B9A1